MEKKLHERSMDMARKVIIEPFVLYIDGEDLEVLELRWVAAGFLAIVCLITTILSSIGLEESLDDAFHVIWANWFLHTFAAILLLSIITRLCRRLGMRKMPAGFIALFTTVPFIALFSMGIDEAFDVIDLDQPKQQDLLTNWLTETADIFPVVALLWAVVIYFLFNKASEFRTGQVRVHSTAEKVDEVARANFLWPSVLESVSEDRRGELISISSDQHYLQVRTTKGDSYVRGVLKDVIEGLSDIDGLSIHRSHWVAENHIEKLMSEDNQMFLLMSNGDKLPVSRRRKNQIRTALMKVETS